MMIFLTDLLYNNKGYNLLSSLKLCIVLMKSVRSFENPV